MSASARRLGPFSLVAISFRELGLAFASRDTILRASGVVELAETRTVEAARVERFVRLRRLVARVFVLFGVVAPLGIVATLAATWWWPEAKGDAIVFGLHLGLGGPLLYVFASIFGMVAASLLTRGLTRELRRK